uniref:Uncharacterized protein n=1 Tax=Photinus pyralis TaxID=7054 RepID=A0A1Y1KKZ2_PHOPY
MSDIEYRSECDDPVDKKWLVVHFVDEECVEIIPKKWYISSIGKSYWPGDSKKVMELIKKSISPSANWHTHKVKVLGEYDDFNKASRKVVKAKTSDVLSSDNSELKKKKNNQTKIMLFFV